MKILVFSDSHASLRFMRQCIAAVRPDAMIHLGDYYDDAAAIQEEYPHIPLHHVPGNCDRYRCPPGALETICYPVDGVMLFMTHGHRHFVKTGIGALLADARRSGAAAVLYGHTHVADCHREPDGLWVLNPGSCGYGGGSAGVLEIADKKITACTLMGQAELEELL